MTKSKREKEALEKLGQVLERLVPEFTERPRAVRRAIDYMPGVTFVDPDLPSRTKKGEADHVNINNIVKRARLTGQIDHARTEEMEFGHWDASEDYMEARLRMQAAEDRFFETVPSELRALVDNDPALFVDWVQDPENESTLRENGLSDLADFYHHKRASQSDLQAPEATEDSPQSSSSSSPESELSAPASAASDNESGG